MRRSAPDIPTQPEDAAKTRPRTGRNHRRRSVSARRVRFVTTITFLALFLVSATATGYLGQRPARAATAAPPARPTPPAPASPHDEPGEDEPATLAGTIGRPLSELLERAERATLVASHLLSDPTLRAAGSAAVERALERTRAAFPEISRIVYARVDGSVIVVPPGHSAATAPDARTGLWYFRAIDRKTAALSEPTAGSPVVRSSRPVYSGSGSLAGVVAADVSVSTIETILAAGVAAGTNGEAAYSILTDRHGSIVASAGPIDADAARSQERVVTVPVLHAGTHAFTLTVGIAPGAASTDPDAGNRLPRSESESRAARFLRRARALTADPVAAGVASVVLIVWIGVVFVLTRYITRAVASRDAMLEEACAVVAAYRERVSNAKDELMSNLERIEERARKSLYAPGVGGYVRRELDRIIETAATASCTAGGLAYDSSARRTAPRSSEGIPDDVTTTRTPSRS